MHAPAGKRLIISITALRAGEDRLSAVCYFSGCNRDLQCAATPCLCYSTDTTLHEVGICMLFRSSQLIVHTCKRQPLRFKGRGAMQTVDGGHMSRRAYHG